MDAFGWISQSIVLEKGTAFINTDFINCTKELGNTLRTQTAHSPWPNDKIETQNHHIVRYWQNLRNHAGNSWFSLAPNFLFLTKHVSIIQLEKHPLRNSLVQNPKFQMSLKDGLQRNQQKRCSTTFCKDSPLHSRSENNMKS